MSFTIFFLGAEQPGWRKLLVDVGASGVGVSFINLSKRMPKRKAYRIADHFPADAGIQVMLDAGGYTANKGKNPRSQREWKDYADEYQLFVEGNIDALDVVTEFDCLALGPDWIHQQRQNFYDHLPPEKFCPIWHAEWGLSELDRLAEEYERVAVPESALHAGRNITPHLNGLVSRTGVKLHGLAMTKTDEMVTVHFESVSSTSWLSPMQYGDTIVWDGTRLRRYPVRYKEQARKRHRNLIRDRGFDADAILADNPSEVARFTVWSWMQLEDYVGRRRSSGAPFSALSGADAEEEPFADLAEEEDSNSPTPDADPDNASPQRVRVANLPPATRNAAQLEVRPDDEMQVLPVIRMEDVVEARVNPDTEVEEDVVVGQRARLQTKSLRRCDTCYINEKCPKFQASSTCAYNIPITVGTKEDRRALLDGIIELQAQRVLEMRHIEQLEGGYADPNLSSEIDRLNKLIATKEEIEDDRDTLKLQVEARGRAGAISRIFGGLGGDTSKLTELPPADRLDETDTNRILEAQLVD